MEKLNTKKELVIELQERLNKAFDGTVKFNRNDATVVADIISEMYTEALVENGVVIIPNVGKLEVGERTCRNPQDATAEPFTVKTVSLKASTKIKDAVNGR